jgi:hypothetical protein
MNSLNDTREYDDSQLTGFFRSTAAIDTAV